jgi:hypothetical protein
VSIGRRQASPPVLALDKVTSRHGPLVTFAGIGTGSSISYAEFGGWAGSSYSEVVNNGRTLDADGESTVADNLD